MRVKILKLCSCLQDDKIFQLEYQLRDNLGAICVAHMALCDQRIKGPNDPDCLRLAQQAADAANFAKTGFPVVLTEELRPQAYPDFMQKPEKESYRSQKVLGKGFARFI
jgi:RNA-dependent RNA polymerase